MKVGRALLVIWLLLLLSACNLEEAAKTGKDIYDAGNVIVPPILTSVPSPFPTLGLPEPIRDYFVLASSADCERVPGRAGKIDPVQSISCHLPGVGVRFDKWMSMEEMYGFYGFPASGIQVDQSKWFDSANQDVLLGDLYRFVDDEGRANIIWTVAGRNLSGWARAADGDQAALYDWWAKIGSEHQ